MAKIKKQIKFSNILLWCVLAFSLVHFTFLMFGLFNVLRPNCLEREQFNYIFSFVLVAICLLIYILFLFIANKKKFVFPEWFLCLIYIGFFMFTNTYYYLGWYESVIGIAFAYAFLAIVFVVISLSIFYNTQKDKNGYLKTTPNYACLTILTYSITFGTIAELIISAFKLIFIPNTVFASLSLFVLDISIIILISAIFTIFFYISLNKEKKFINGCLIKIYKD